MPPFSFCHTICRNPPTTLDSMKMPTLGTALCDRSDFIALLFQPPPALPEGAPEGETVSLSIGEFSFACRFFSVSQEAVTLLYYHGGCESADTFGEEAKAYNQAGVNLFLFSYRGFAGSTGTPSLDTLLSDGDALMLLALRWLDESGYVGPRFVFGRSLGSVCAVDAASRHQAMLKGLILESAYCEAGSLLTTLGVDIRSDISDEEGFGMLAKLGHIKLATSIFHGAKDQLVPIAQAEKLQAVSAAKSKQFLLVPGATHGNVAMTAGPLYFQAIKTFTDTVCGHNTWRERRRRFQSEQKGKS